MGFLTVIAIHNDALGEFRDHPEAFGQALLDGIDETLRTMMPATVPFYSNGNSIKVFPSRHADDASVYVNLGNTVTELGRSEFASVQQRAPEFAVNLVQVAKAAGED